MEQRRLLGFVALSLLVCVVCGDGDAPEALSRIMPTPQEVPGSVDFSYDHDHGPLTWTGLCNPDTPNRAAKQSPVDIVTSQATEEGALAEAVSYRYKPFSKLLVFNQGPQIFGTWGKGDAGFVTYAHEKWEADSFVVHAPSEHKIDGKQFGMEVQISHKNSKGKKLVIGVLIDTTGNTTSVSSSILDQYLANLPEGSGEMKEVEHSTGVDTLLPAPRDVSSGFRPFYGYQGSETTPPCAEDAEWIVMQDVVKGDFSRQAAFRKVMGVDNVRPTQPLNERTIRKTPKVRPSVTSPPMPQYEYSGARGPAYWSQFNQDCAAKSQSPINIKPAAATVDHSLDSSVEFDYSESSDVTLHLEDSMLKMVFGSQSTSAVTFAGTRYVLRYMEIHTPSEHQIDGHPAQMECQLYHTPDGDDSKSGKLAVSVLYRSGDKHNAFWDEIFDVLPSQKALQSHVGKPVNPYGVLPHDLGFYTYDGSMTSPPCAEDITWVVFKASRTLATKQLGSLLKIANNNARPVQDLHDRPVKMSMSIFEDGATVATDASYNAFGNNNTTESAGAGEQPVQAAGTPEMQFQESIPRANTATKKSRKDIGNDLEREVGAMTSMLDSYVSSKHGEKTAKSLTGLVGKLSRSIGNRNSAVQKLRKDPRGLGVTGLDLPEVPTLSDVMGNLKHMLGSKDMARIQHAGDEAQPFKQPELDEPKNDAAPVHNTNGALDPNTGIDSDSKRSLFTDSSMAKKVENSGQGASNPTNIASTAADAVNGDAESQESGDFKLNNGEDPIESTVAQAQGKKPQGKVDSEADAAVAKASKQAVEEEAAKEQVRETGRLASDIHISQVNVKGNDDGPVKHDRTGINVHYKIPNPDPEGKDGELTYQHHANRHVFENVGDLLPVEPRQLEPPVPAGVQSNSAAPPGEPVAKEDVLLADIRFDAYVGETLSAEKTATDETIVVRAYEDGKCLHMCSATLAAELPDQYVLEFDVKKNVHANYELTSFVSNPTGLKPLIFVVGDGSRANTGAIPVFGSQIDSKSKITVHAECNPGFDGVIPYAIEVKVTSEDDSGKAVIYGQRNCKNTKTASPAKSALDAATDVANQNKPEEMAQQADKNAAVQRDSVDAIDGDQPHFSGSGDKPASAVWDKTVSMEGDYKKIDDVLGELYTNVEATTKKGLSKEDKVHAEQLRSEIDSINLKMKGLQAILETLEGAFGSKWEEGTTNRGKAVADRKEEIDKKIAEKKDEDEKAQQAQEAHENPPAAVNTANPALAAAPQPTTPKPAVPQPAAPVPLQVVNPSQNAAERSGPSGAGPAVPSPPDVPGAAVSTAGEAAQVAKAKAVKKEVEEIEGQSQEKGEDAEAAKADAASTADQAKEQAAGAEVAKQVEGNASGEDKGIDGEAKPASTDQAAQGTADKSMEKAKPSGQDGGDAETKASDSKDGDNTKSVPKESTATQAPASTDSDGKDSTTQDSATKDKESDAADPTQAPSSSDGEKTEGKDEPEKSTNSQADVPTGGDKSKGEASADSSQNAPNKKAADSTATSTSGGK